MTKVFTVIIMVCPSGGRVAAYWEPMLPLAPGRFSMVTAWPQRLLQLLAEDARKNVDAGAGGERHDDRDRAVRQPPSGQRPRH